MANEDPKWDSKREQYTTVIAAASIVLGFLFIVVACFLKDFDYAKNLWALIGGLVGGAAGYMYGSNNTKISEVKVRTEKEELAGGASGMLARMEELEGAIEGFKKNEERYKEIVEGLEDNG
jgi:hypothetical protein